MAFFVVPWLKMDVNLIKYKELLLQDLKFTTNLWIRHLLLEALVVDDFNLTILLKILEVVFPGK